ncbi:semaphorin-4G isoform X3 [Phascolarctos cinereus]|uniref:Semaphorin-4G isoform X3 n=1 Tax=Phascolarctos cinereus TaxID=38626 RepID=A0A6P5IV74_PHACI|nr:semaphorin-4G isoform X3 [Phascolarctos cinereus]
MWEGLGPLLLCLLMVSSAPGPPPRRPARELDATPRTTIPYEELSEARHFGGHAHNYSTLLLEEASGRLLVGARGALFSLNAQDIGDGAHREIRWEASPETQSECVRKGRNNQDSEAFALPPSFEEGKEKCPYDPARGYTGLIVDGGLYTATRYEFRSIPDIRRSRHPRSLRTEESPLHWLNDAEFVFSVLIRESEASTVGDDDKVYYFFTERATEEGGGFSQIRGHRVARVARVCKGDLGGKKILQKKWTSFLKARLTCHIPLYETLRSVCSLDGGSWAHTRFYAAFSLATQWRTLEASAICRYDLSDVQASFSGPYMEYQDGTRRWGRYDGTVPEPRPGSCITDGLRRRGYNSSQDLPSPVLDFVKLHPLMARVVGPARGRPLLLKRNIRYTRLVGTPVTVLTGLTYDVLFLGTADGWIHKAVVLGLGMHIIEEAQVFMEPQPVENLVISLAQHSLYVGAPSGVVQLPLSRCSRYSSCYDCILARDPYCGWAPSVQACQEAATVPNRTALIQDMERGNRGCQGSVSTEPHLLPRNRSVLRGDDVLLPCDQPSNLARASWLLNGSRMLMDGRDGYRVGVDGLLVMDTRPEHSGHYSCYAEENGLRTLLASYGLTVQQALPAPALAPDLVPPALGAHLTPDVRLLYLLTIAALGGLCLVLASVLLYVACLRGTGHRRKYSLARGTGRAGGSAVQLQTVSGQCPGEEEDEGDEGTDRAGGPEGGGLRIIPGEGTPAPPPPPPPPPPTELSNGLAALPSRLRRMNGNSYVLLQQNEERAPTLPCSFTEELSRILEKRKHTQLVERLDESSV